MTKADIVDNVSNKLGCTKDDAYDLVELTLETLKEAIAKEGHVKISGFGNFIVKQKAPAGEEIRRPVRRSPSPPGRSSPSRQARY